jgi:uncharacterized membrane protein
MTVTQHPCAPSPRGEADATALFFDATLHPHRSLGKRGFLILMSAIAGCGFAVGTGFALVGAWPVLGFAGLEILLVYIAFRLNYRAARAHERVRLAEGWLEVARVDWRGRAAAVRLEPAWLSIDLERPVEQDTPLLLRSRGRALEIGRFLTPEERVEVAGALAAALARMKAPGLAQAIPRP